MLSNLLKSLSFLGFSLILFALPQNANAQKIGWVNFEKVLSQSNPGKKFQKQEAKLRREFARKRKKLESPLYEEEKRLQQEYNQLKEKAKYLSQQEREKLVVNFQQKYNQHMAKVQDAQKKLIKLQQDLNKKLQQKVLTPFHKLLRKAARKLAKQQNFSYILVHDPNNPQLFLYADPKYDVTKDLIRILNSGK